LLKDLHWFKFKNTKETWLHNILLENSQYKLWNHSDIVYEFDVEDPEIIIKRIIKKNKEESLVKIEWLRYVSIIKFSTLPKTCSFLMYYLTIKIRTHLTFSFFSLLKKNLNLLVVFI
jgi:hypothetical protein